MGKTLVARAIALVAAAFLAGCGSSPPPPADPTKETWYGQTVEQLNAMNRDADALFHDGKSDQAAALIEKGQPLVKRLLDVPKPTLAAVEAASDLDDLYGRMLLSNRHYAWARLMFQKNHSRWKIWSPQSPETVSRLKRADNQIEECDREMTK